ncbi:Aspartate carbamoyltransferase [Planctomycetes bacterium LzC2]|uniref:Aspartate carbamoyltransferase n=1 Tax=Alienimonas chondri TaxID=2681879 RepID=A0ABX1VE29_9PLAN|nr:Aspartate carbamoyltransferase [Alienimonas chondri]
MVGLADLNGDEITELLDRAVEFRRLADERALPSPLAGATVGNLFFENSTRTRNSFRLAAKRLGAETVEFTEVGSSVAKGETVADTVRTIEALGVDLMVIRHGSPGVPHRLREFVTSGLLNAGDGTHEHPTQALIDLLSLRDAFSQEGTGESLAGKTVTVVGDILHSRVARSNIHGLRALGARVLVCGPSTLLPRQLPGAEFFTDLDAALAQSDAVNLLRVQFERQRGAFFPSPAEYYRLFGMTQTRLTRSGRDPWVLAPGPINRGIELSSEVADGPRSLILKQVANGVFIRMACLATLMEARR